MADQSQLDVLLQGVEAWNEWRERNPRNAADPSGANLSGAILEWAYLSGADLSGADLSGAKLSRTNLSGAKLFVLKPDLRRANLSETANITQKQIEQAIGNEQPELPEYLTPPASWSQSSHDQQTGD